MSNWYHLIDTHDPSGKGVWEMQFLVFLTLRHQGHLREMWEWIWTTFSPTCTFW